MSNIELPPLPLSGLAGMNKELLKTMEAYARAAVELNQKPASADVEALEEFDFNEPMEYDSLRDLYVKARDMLRSLDAERQEGESVLLQSGPITCRNGEQHERINDCLYCRIAALELNDNRGIVTVRAGVTDVEAMCARLLDVLRGDNSPSIITNAIAMLRSLSLRVDALEVMLVSKQIQIDTLEMLRERDAPSLDQKNCHIPPPPTACSSSGDSSSSTTTSATTSSTGLSIDAPVRTGEVPSIGTIDQYHEPGLGLNKGDY